MRTSLLRKSISFILLAAALHLPLVASAQTSTIITIGDTNNMYLLTSGNIRFPCMYYSASYTQQLVQSDELNGEAMITGIDFYCGSPSSTGCPGCTIYLANTYVPNMGSGMVGFGPLFQLVAVDSLVCTVGWNHYEFDTAFHYNGLGNLIVAVDCPNGWSGGNFYVAQRGVLDSRYATTLLANITPSTTTTVSTCRNIMRLHTQPVPASAATCPAPTLWVDSLGATAMKLRWSPGYQDTSWAVECITDGDTAWHTSGLVWGDTSYTMTGLMPNCDYTFRLTAFCTDTFTTVLKHVLTNCLPTALPYAENLESSWSIPGCWYVVPGAAGDKPLVSSSYSHTGSHAVQLEGGAVVLPDFDATPDSLELYFWAKSNGGSNRNLYVGMVTDPLDMSTFVPLDTVTVPNYTNWVAAAVRTNRYPRSSGRLAIVTADPLNTHMYIDDIEVSHIVPCEALAPVTVDWVTDTAALVRWSDPVGAVYYDVAYGLAGFVPDSTTIVTDIRTDSLLLTGLLPYTQYDVYVRPECGSFTAHWSPVTMFRTFCSALDTLPYAEDFDSYTGYPMPNELPCWRGQVEANTYVVTVTGGGHSGARAVRWWWSAYDLVTDQHTILPAINSTVLPIRTLQLSFWARNMENTYNRYDEARLVVGVMSNPDVDSTFQAVDTVDIVGEDWVRYDVPLSSYSGTGNYITVKSCASIGSRNQWAAFIDDLSLDLLPPCANVTGMMLTGLTSTSVTVEWNAADSGTRWQTYIDSSATAVPVADTMVLSLPTCTFSGLVAEMPYYVWVRAICPKGDTSGWEGPMQVVPGMWNMRANRNDTLTMCGVNLYDDGGASADYSAQTSTLVILPDIPGHLVSISGLCDIGSSSTLTIYDGVGTSGSVLWTKTINNNYAAIFGPVTSSVGAVTLYFRGMTPFSHYNHGFELQVSCVPNTCIVHHLRLDPSVTASDSGLVLTWDCNGASLYEVEYGPVGFTPGSGTLDSTTTNHYTIGGLASLDRREVHVRSICGEGDTGAWVQGIFTSQPCSNVVYRENYDSTFMENSVPSLPIGFNGNPYSYVQTIIDSAHLAGLEGGITALAFHPIDNMVGDHQSGIRVYLANVADTAFASGPILPDAGHRFVKVIDSTNFCHDATTDWQLISFDHPFMWDGHQNLLVAVLRQDGGSGMRTEYAGHFRYSDLTGNINRGYVITGYSPIDIDSADVYTTPYHYGNYNSYGTYLVGDLRLYTNTCDLPLCTAPVIDTVTGDYESVTVAWSGTFDQYQVGLNSETPVAVTGGSYTFSGLLPNTTYQIRVRQNCAADSLGFSDWAVVSFTTDSFSCLAPEGLNVYDISHNSATLDWVSPGSDGAWQLEVWQPGNRHISLSITERPYTLEGLMPGTEYCAYIHSFCGSAGQIAGEWSDTVCFTTAICPKVTGLDTTAVTSSSVSLVWDMVSGAQDYLLEYGPAGYMPGSGTEQVVAMNSFTVTGLMPATAYDFYVRTRCAEGWLAGEYAHLPNIATRQPVGIAEPQTQFQFSLLPNPAKGVTMVRIVGLPSKLSGVLHVTVSDLSGRDVIIRDLECDGQCQMSLDIEGLSAGAYFVRITSTQGSAVRKMIVK